MEEKKQNVELKTPKREKVPIREEDRTKPYYKYFEKEVFYGPQILHDAADKPLLEEEVLRHEDINRLLEPGYLPGENGWFDFHDGTGYTAGCKTFPNATVEMLEWWFVWQGLDSFRYSIWSPEEHCGLEITDEVRDLILNPNYSNREKIWSGKIKHTVTEDKIGMGKGTFNIGFVNPVMIGFDPDAISKFNGTLVCGALPKEQGLLLGDGKIMAHVIRPVSGGVEVRTRFWMGYAVDDKGHAVKVVKEGTTECRSNPKFQYLHDVREFSNLSTFLPELYSEYKGKIE